MTSTRGSIEVAVLVNEIRRGIAAADLGMSDAAFDRLSQNIARAILRALAEGQTQRPDFGEEDRSS